MGRARRDDGAVSAEVGSGTARLVPDPDRPNAWTLTVDGTPQSHVDLTDPTRLEFEYVRWLAQVAAAVEPAGAPLDVLHLGGGAWTLARQLAVTRPGSRQRVVELDGALADLVREHLPSGPRSGIRVRIDDARAVLESARPASADLVVLDAFSGAVVPAHLSTVECLRAAAAVLRPGGVLAMNLADGAPLRFARAAAATVAAAFTTASLISTPSVLRGRRFGNVVLLGSAAPLPVDELIRSLAAEVFPARLVSAERFAEFVAGAAPMTDATRETSPAPPPGWLTDLAGR